MIKDLYLAGGCFWGAEHFFKQIDGVVFTEVGFANGHTPDPTYKQVYTDTTGYAETVHIRYDSARVGLEFLLRMFFKAIDPTSLNKQGEDEGIRYRTGIYYTDPAEMPLIRGAVAREQLRYASPLVVEVRPLENFYRAEEYHQDYLDKNPGGYCHLPLDLFRFAREARPVPDGVNPFFPEIRKNFGFGCMRLPMKKGQVDLDETSRMVDLFLESGFNYFDTAHGYLDGKSETALKACLTSRYPRDRYLLVDKLTRGMFEKSPEGIRNFFAMQLEACGVDYFDFYLMHAQNSEYFEEFRACRAYETAFELKAEGKIRHIGISFHDKAEVLDRILTTYPEIELVQIQFNYVDYDDAGIQSRLCYEVCEKHGKPVVVMEPVKGGNLAHLPADAAKILSDLGAGMSQASYAIRFAASFPQIMMTLSGMSHLDQMQDNLSFMKDFQPLAPEEHAALAKVRELFQARRLIACTGCRYCTAGCPMQISIPDLFADLNAKSLHKDWNSDWYFMVHTQGHGKPSDCIECGQCEGVCPQHLPIIETLKEAVRVFEKKQR